MSVTREHLAKTQPKTLRNGVFTRQENRPFVECVDGFSVSIQASESHYCVPREDGLRGGYSYVELGYPSERDELIMPYAASPDTPTDTVYGYVPVSVVDALIAKHGGLKK